MNLADAYHAFYMAVLVCLSVLTLFCLFRAIQGPRIADRIVSINMICTLTMTMICILAAMLGEGYLVDVALIYALLGFLAVVVLCKVYTGVYLQRKGSRADNLAIDDNLASQKGAETPEQEHKEVTP
mgnify:CR=1 FL=1